MMVRITIRITIHCTHVLGFCEEHKKGMLLVTFNVSILKIDFTTKVLIYCIEFHYKSLFVYTPCDINLIYSSLMYQSIPKPLIPPPGNPRAYKHITTAVYDYRKLANSLRVDASYFLHCTLKCM